MIIRAGEASTIGQRPVIRVQASRDVAKWRSRPAPVTSVPQSEEHIPTTAPTPARPYCNLFLSLSPRTIAGESIGEVLATQDRNTRTVTFGTAVSDFTLTVTGNVVRDQLMLATDHPSIATVSGNTISWVSDGSTVLRAIYGGELLAAVNLTMRTLSSSSYELFDSFVSGTLAHHCENAVNSRIGTATPAMLPVFSTQDHNTPAYVRNTACWCYDLRQKMTCISPWNSSGANTRAVTLIAPDVVAMAAHYPVSLGATVRFITANNEMVTRTVSKLLRHPDFVPNYPDITLGLLDSAVPETITPCKVLPANYTTKLPSGPKYIAALCLDQEEKALVTDLLSFQPNGVASFTVPNLPYEKALYEAKVAGDSGNPAFLIVDGELVLLTTWTWGGAGSGTFITPQIGALNSMMASLGSTHTLTSVDLSAFTEF